jgi:CDP-4-dehydro-6-deoxyglucose reductase, E3
MTRVNCPVISIEHYNQDTRQVLLQVPEPNQQEFKAGQYLEMILPSKRCPFSIANSPTRKGVIELHIRPTPNSDDSVAIESLLDSTPSHIEIEFPKGDCFLETAPANTLVLLAASTGVTQMKSILEFLMPGGIKNPVYLYWGVIADKDLYLGGLFNEWAEAHDNFHYIPVVSEPDTSPDWQGKTGLVGEVVLSDFDTLADVTVYVSGGPGMVYATLDSFMDRGMPEGSMYSDIFSYAPRQNS